MPYAKKGDWVQISKVILPPGKRAPQVPDETQRVPLKEMVKGFLLNDAEKGDEVIIRTVIGSKIKGKLKIKNPEYSHNFGEPVPELLLIGQELWEIIGRGEKRKVKGE